MNVFLLLTKQYIWCHLLHFSLLYNHFVMNIIRGWFVNNKNIHVDGPHVVLHSWASKAHPAHKIKPDTSSCGCKIMSQFRWVLHCAVVLEWCLTVLSWEERVWSFKVMSLLKMIDPSHTLLLWTVLGGKRNEQWNLNFTEYYIGSNTAGDKELSWP